MKQKIKPEFTKEQPQKSPADVTLELIVQIRTMLGCNTREALEVYKQLKAEATPVEKG